MGVKYKREYDDIIEEMSDGIHFLGNFFEFFGMDKKDWEKIGQQEQNECIKTLSDDILYALGNESVVSVGSGTVKYDRDNNLIKIYSGDNCIHIINLI